MSKFTVKKCHNLALHGKNKFIKNHWALFGILDMRQSYVNVHPTQFQWMIN